MSSINLPPSNINSVELERQPSNAEVQKVEFLQEVDVKKPSYDLRDIKAENLNKNPSQPAEDQEALDDAIEIVSAFMNQPLENVNFQQDESSGKTVIKVFDVETKELIKQFPSEKVIEMAQKVKSLQMEIGEKTGILIDDKI